VDSGAGPVVACCRGAHGWARRGRPGAVRVRRWPKEGERKEGKKQERKEKGKRKGRKRERIKEKEKVKMEKKREKELGTFEEFLEKLGGRKKVFLWGFLVFRVLA
jgi:hypothetical protein